MLYLLIKHEIIDNLIFLFGRLALCRREYDLMSYSRRGTVARATNKLIKTITIWAISAVGSASH